MLTLALCTLHTTNIHFSEIGTWRMEMQMNSDIFYVEVIFQYIELKTFHRFNSHFIYTIKMSDSFTYPDALLSEYHHRRQCEMKEKENCMYLIRFIRPKALIISSDYNVVVVVVIVVAYLCSLCHRLLLLLWFTSAAADFTEIFFFPSFISFTFSGSCLVCFKRITRKTNNKRHSYGWEYRLSIQYPIYLNHFPLTTQRSSSFLIPFSFQVKQKFWTDKVHSPLPNDWSWQKIKETVAKEEQQKLFSNDNCQNEKKS